MMPPNNSLPNAVSSTPLPPPTSPPSTPAGLQPHIYTAQDLIENPLISNTLTTFINIGYQSPAVYPPTHWRDIGDRFKTPTAIHEALGPRGLIAVIFNGDGEKSEPVACACASPWKGDLYPAEADGTKLEAPQEIGWEIKAVVTKEGWNKMGLAGRCVEMLTKEIARREYDVKVRLWIHMVDEVNGEYWRRRGYKEVRRSQVAAGTGNWGSRFGFQLVVMVKDVDINEISGSVGIP